MIWRATAVIVLCAGAGCTARTGFDRALRDSPGDANPSDGSCQPEASAACADGDLYWFDSCGNRGTVRTDCGGRGCTAAACRPEGWFGLDGSELAPWSVRATWDAARGSGVSMSDGPSFSPALLADTSDRAIVAWNELVSNVQQIYLRRLDGGAWVELGDSASAGGVSDTGAASTAPALALNRDGEPLVAWAEAAEPFTQIYLARYDGANWVELGADSARDTGVSDTAGPSFDPAIQIDDTGAPVLVWTDELPGVAQVFIRRFDGSSWVEITPGSASTGVSGTTRNAFGPTTALDATGNLVVAWDQVQPDDSSDIYVRRLVAGMWQEMGLGSASPGGVNQSEGLCSQPAFALSSTGELLIAWENDAAGNREVLVRQFDGADWIEVGAGSGSPTGISSTSGNSDTASVVFDVAPVVVWEENVGGSDAVYAARFDGSSWLEAASGTLTGRGMTGHDVIDGPTAISVAGTAWVAWARARAWGGDIYVGRLDGSGLGVATASGTGASGTSESSMQPSIDVPGDGTVLVAWVEGRAPNTEIFAKRFDGSSWGDLGLGSATGGGVSNNGGQSVYPVIRSAGDVVYLVWSDDSAGEYEIYAKRFTGGIWSEAGLGSASGPGISGTPGVSSGPALAVGAGDLPVVAWADDIGANREVYVRRFDGVNSWAELALSGSGGGISDNSGNSDSVAITIDGADRPVVVWEDASQGADRIFVRRFEAGAWVELPAGSASIGISTLASDGPTAVTGNDGQPVLAWAETDGSDMQIRVARFDGAAWMPLSASVTTTANESILPRLAIDRSGRPVLAWMEIESRNQNVRVARFDGTWLELHAGSASGGGISNSDALTWRPRISANAGLICVAWDEPADPMEQIFVRCSEDF